MDHAEECRKLRGTDQPAGSTVSLGLWSCPSHLMSVDGALRPQIARGKSSDVMKTKWRINKLTLSLMLRGILSELLLDLTFSFVDVSWFVECTSDLLQIPVCYFLIINVGICDFLKVTLPIVVLGFTFCLYFILCYIYITSFYFSSLF